MRTERNYTIDLLRVIAAFGVIAIHVHASTPSAKMIGNFFSPLCVPFFFITSLAYFISSLNGMTIKDILTKSFFRLLIPYFSWTIIYTLLLLSKSVLMHGTFHFVASETLLYGGSGVQMYYLPDLMALQSITLGIYTLANPAYQNKLYSVLLLTSGILFVWIGNYNQYFGLTAPGMVLKFGFFIFCGFVLSSIIYNFKTNILYVIIGLALIAFSVVSIFKNYSYSLMNYPVTITLGGAGLTLLGIGAPLKRLPNWLKQLSADSYGIYLCHVMFLEGFETLAGKLFHNGLVYDFPTKLGVVIFLFIVAVIFTNLVRRISFLRQFLLGERGSKSLNFKQERQASVSI